MLDSAAATRHRKSRAVGAHRNVRRAVFALAQTVREPPRARRRADLERVRKVGAYREHARRIHLLDERAETRFHVLEIAIDIGVIELDRRNNRAARPVMQKLWSFV